MIKFQNEGDVCVARYSGEFLDASNAKQFRENMTSITAHHSRVLLDLSGVQFVDSSGLGAILSSLRQLNALGGDLKVCGLSKPVQALFELVRMHKILDLYATSTEALASFHRMSAAK